MLHTNNQIIKHKVGLLNLAEELQNVSKACKVMRVSRDTHQNIKKFFRNAQMFGFTGTSIFEENSQSKAGLKLTTDYLFNECLHQYVIVDAIRDRNVLQFQIDYQGKYTAKGMQNKLDYDDEVEGIYTQKLYDNPQRLEMIARYIVETHDTKTRNREFTAMFCVSSVDTLSQQYTSY